MTLLFTFLLLAHAERPLGAPNVTYRRPPVRQIDTSDPIYLALQRIFPNFMSFRTQKVDEGLYKFTKDRLRKLNTKTKREYFLRALENTTINESQNALGTFYSEQERIELKTCTTRHSRKVLAHELQHAFDYADRPFATGIMNPIKTAMLEWRAAMAERDLMDFAFTKVELHREWAAIDRKVKTKVEARSECKDRFFCIAGRPIHARAGVNLESEDVETVYWRAALSSRIDSGPKLYGFAHLLGYIPEMIVDIITHPVALVCELALLALPYLH